MAVALLLVGQMRDSLRAAAYNGALVRPHVAHGFGVLELTTGGFDFRGPRVRNVDVAESYAYAVLAAWAPAYTLRVFRKEEEGAYRSAYNCTRVDAKASGLAMQNLKVAVALDMMEQWERARGTTFTHVFKARPDVRLSRALPPPSSTVCSSIGGGGGDALVYGPARDVRKMRYIWRWLRDCPIAEYPTLTRTAVQGTNEDGHERMCKTLRIAGACSHALKPTMLFFGVHVGSCAISGSFLPAKARRS